MNPINDIICSLIETPFSRWKEEDKRDILRTGRPTFDLSISAKKEVKKIGKTWNVHFKNSWFSTCKWLCSSQYFQKLYCWPCLLFSNKKSVWNKEGFDSILNVSRSLHKHEDSGEHIKCELFLKQFEKNQSTIVDALKENGKLYKIQFNENVRLNRLFLRTVVDTALYLAQQELAFRGHDESSESINRGNFKELLKLLISRDTPELKCHYEKIKSVFTGESKTIQNEVIECISDYINQHVKNELNGTAFFSVQVDDTTDIAQNSQCSVIIRYINLEGIIVERFLGFHNVSADRTAENLYVLLDNILNQFDYEHKLIGQCYDGASVMSGHLNGLQKRIKEKAPQAVFVHCLAHRLNLVMQQSLKKIAKCRIFFASLSGIPSFFHHSAKRTYALASTSARRMPTIAETRWSSNSKLLNVIIQDWHKLKEVFDFIINSTESDAKSIQLAKGFLREMNDFEFTFLALVFNDIFSVTEILFDILQKKSLDINFCISNIHRCKDMLNNKRNDTFFNTMFEKANSVTDININTGTRQFARLSHEEIRGGFRALFYEIIDHILMEMGQRFQDCEKLQFLCLADTSKFAQYNLCFPSAPFEHLLESYGGHIFTKNQRLKNELSLIFADESCKDLSLQDLIKKMNENKDIFTEAYKMFCLILTIPSTSASAERSFSCLKRIKTYLRNTMSQQRLTSLANISIQSELLQEIKATTPFYEEVIDNFASLKERRIDLIYKK